MEARSLPEALKLIMEQRGCSQNQLARDLKKGQPWISNVIRGKAGLEFARVIKILSRVGWEVIIRPKSENSDPVKRREFVAAAASVMFVPSPKVEPHHDPAYVAQLAKRVARARYEHGGGAIASTAIRHIRRIEHLVTSRDRKLQEAASELAVEGVWTLNELCRLEVGENVGRLALELAGASGSTHAQSRAYSALATLNLDNGNAERALIYAKRGVDLTEVPGTQQTWMRLRKGWTLARVAGHKTAARDEIESVRGILQDGHGLRGQSDFEVADITGTIALSLHDLGVYGEAQKAFNASVSGLEESSPALAAFFLAHQIRAALSASQVSLAASRMLKFARLAPLVNSPRVDKHVREVLVMSARWGSVPDMRDARAQLETVVHRNDRVPR